MLTCLGFLCFFQTPEETLRRAADILGPQNTDLFVMLEPMIAAYTPTFG